MIDKSEPVNWPNVWWILGADHLTFEGVMGDFRRKCPADSFREEKSMPINSWEQISYTHSRPQCLRVWECARKLWETLPRSSHNLAIWASQRMLFDPTKTFCFFYIYFIAKVLCCFGIRTEEIQLKTLKNFQVSKALVVAGEKIPLNVPNHRFAYTWQLIK